MIKANLMSCRAFVRFVNLFIYFVWMRIPGLFHYVRVFDLRPTGRRKDHASKAR